jgi:hypothetical protein
MRRIVFKATRRGRFYPTNLFIQYFGTESIPRALSFMRLTGNATSAKGLETVYNFYMATSARDDVVTKIKSHRRALRRYGVKSLALFGSAARNTMRKRSDVDVLVQFDNATWANYIGLKFYLEDLLDREVDLVTPNALKPAIKPSVEKDLFYVVS